MSLLEVQENINSHTGFVCDIIMKSSLARQTQHNLSAILITFQNFENIFKKHLIKSDVNLKQEIYLITEPSPTNKKSKLYPRIKSLKSNIRNLKKFSMLNTSK